MPAQPDLIAQIERTLPNDKLLVAGYPKSGNTWLGYMLTYILGAKYVDLHQPLRVTKDQSVQSKIGWLGAPAHRCLMRYVCKTHDRYARHDYLPDFTRRLLIVRDPRDVIVSYYYFLYHNCVDDTRETSYGKLHTLVAMKRVVFMVLRQWRTHYYSWQRNGAIIVKYEDLSMDPVGTLQQTLDQLQISVDAAIITKAVEAFSFETLSGGRQRGDAQNHAFFRKGVVGDHTNHLHKIDLAIVQSVLGGPMQSLGYL